MFEAQEGPHGEALRELDASDPRMHAVLAAAGDHVGDTHFIANDPFGGAATAEPSGEYDIVVPMTTVDTEVERLGLAGPYLLKLDTHGFEVPILEGAASTLGETILLVIEVYNFELRPSALRFHELVDYLERRGFRVIDLAGVAWRPRDRALWQMDLVFLRDDQPEFDSSKYE
jgi:FkbM family methyltransferase